MTHLQKGDQVPQFEAIDHLGNKISSEKLLGTKYAIYFYPKDATPGCTVQACNLRDHYAELQDAGIFIFGVSKDNVESHVKFAQKQDLPFPLIADTELKLLNLFGVWGEKKFMGKVYDGIHRTTFVINEKGTIVEIIKKPKTKFHAEEILEILK